MNTTSSNIKRKPAKKAAPRKSREATALLRADHKLVSGLFADYENARTMPSKKKIADHICMELTVHAQVEEEIFYPAFKKALKDTELVPEATVEHASLKELIAQIEGEETDVEMFDARVKVLSEYVKHHVKEEQEEMFKKARSSDMDLVELGVQIASRKLELMDDLANKPKGLINQLIKPLFT